MLTSLVSLLLKKPVRHDVAMTGEITLRGLVLPIGGLKEKVLAAKTAGIKTVLLPERNKKDVPEIPAEARKGLTFIFVKDCQGRPQSGARRRLGARYCGGDADDIIHRSHVVNADDVHPGRGA